MEAFERSCEALDNDIAGQSLLTTIVTDEGAVYAVYSNRKLHDECAAAALEMAPLGESAVAAGSSTAHLSLVMTASACQPEHPSVAWPGTAESVLPIVTVARTAWGLQAGLPLPIAARGSLHSSTIDAREKKWFDRIFEAEPGSGQPIRKSSMKRYCD